MAQSLSRILLHVVFSTKNRKPFIDSSIEKEVHSYLATVCKAYKCDAYKIGGVEDHDHMFISLHRTVTTSFLVEQIKKKSSKWIKTKANEYSDFSWQRGFGAFSISVSHGDALNHYIETQREHHKKVSFQDEFRNLLGKYQVSVDEKYVWD